MNLLAHAYLSFNDDEILIGNMISDFVKGKKQFDYSIHIQKGITLHRQIDTFTDNHETTRSAKFAFKPFVGLYAGAFVDVVYDYFLANDKQIFSSTIELENFTEYVYTVIETYLHITPISFQKLFPYMKKDNWLLNYHNKNGIKKSFQNIYYRAKYLNLSNKAFEAFEENIEMLCNCYEIFFPQLKENTRQQYNQFKIK
jgi:acyl carrier protein phosphodiesterase